VAIEAVLVHETSADAVSSDVVVGFVLGGGL
jgi:hypothetical protein